MKGKYQNIRTWRRWMAYPFIFLLLASPVACSNDAPPVGNTVVGRDSLPVMVTRGVSKIITDSGIVRYKIITEEWRIYDKTTPPRWEFPKGLFLERYDNKFKVDLRFAADSAWLYDQNLWKLRGHVLLDDKTSQSKLRTQELYWNMRTGEMSSNVHTYLKQPEQEIEGNWFRATLQNGHATQYHVKQSSGFMPMGDIGGTSATSAPAQSGATNKDTAAAQPQHEAPVSRPKSFDKNR